MADDGKGEDTNETKLGNNFGVREIKWESEKELGKKRISKVEGEQESLAPGQARQGSTRQQET